MRKNLHQYSLLAYMGIMGSLDIDSMARRYTPNSYWQFVMGKNFSSKNQRREPGHVCRRHRKGKRV